MSAKVPWDVVVVGGGPAGLSAALLLGRCTRRVLICDTGEPRNASAVAMHGYLGFDGVAPDEFLGKARGQLKTYPSITWQHCRVMEVRKRAAQGFDVLWDGGGEASGRAIILATGVRDRLPDVPDIRSFYGRSVHHCPYCDGWEHRHQEMGVLGIDREAIAMATELRLWARSIRLFPVGGESMADEEKQALQKLGIEVAEAPVSELLGQEGRLEAVMAGGRIYPCQALFFASVQTHQSDLGAGIGCRLAGESRAIECGENGRTCVEGVFVAGNVSQGIQMAIMAAAEGVKAAAAANDWLLSQEEQFTGSGASSPPEPRTIPPCGS